MFSIHTKTKSRPAFSNLYGLKSVFEKLRFRDGLMWTVGLTVEIELCFFKFLRCSVDAACKEYCTISYFHTSLH